MDSSYIVVCLHLPIGREVYTQKKIGAAFGRESRCNQAEMEGDGSDASGSIESPG